MGFRNYVFDFQTMIINKPDTYPSDWNTMANTPTTLLHSDGSVNMDVGYTPSVDLSISTKGYSDGLYQGSIQYTDDEILALTTYVNSTFSLNTHTHDDRYYTETEMDTLLGGKSDVSHNHDLDYAPLSHNHNDIYYTETEVDNLLTGYSLTTHNHDGVYEPVFSKNTAFNKNFGTTAGTVAQGDDSRINNGQTAYSWGNHALAGYLTSFTETDPVFTAHTVSNIINGTGFLKNNGTGTWSWDNNSYSLSSHNHNGVYEPANSNIQTHIADSTLHYTMASISITESQISDLGTNILLNSDIGVSVQSYNANTVIDASYVHTDNNYTTTEKNKLAGIEVGAEVNNISDANALDLTDGGSTTLHTHDNTLRIISELWIVDLNDYTTTGIYTQSQNTDAASGTNYPIAAAGVLEVIAWGGFVSQRYHVYGATNSMYIRTHYSGVWYAWKLIS